MRKGERSTWGIERDRQAGPRAAMIAALASAIVGCTPFAAGTDELVAERAELGAADPGRDWSCLGSSDEPVRPHVPAVMGDARRVVQSVQFVSLVTGEVIPGLSVRACPQRDVECASPLSEFEPLGADGYVDIVLYEGFAGFLAIVPPTTILVRAGWLTGIRFVPGE